MLRLKDLREDKDYRQIDVAKATGIDQKTLSNYETGKTKPDSDSLILLADFFDVSIDYLVKRTNINVRHNSDIKKELTRCIDKINEIIKTL